MKSKPVRIKDDVKERLADFVKDQTVERKRGHGPMTLGEGVDFLFNKYEEDYYIKILFKLQHSLSSFIKYQDNPWDYTLHSSASDVIDCVRYFYEFLKIRPYKNSSNVRVRDFYQRLTDSLKDFIDEYKNLNLHE